MSLKFTASTITRRIELTGRSIVLLFIAAFAAGNAYGQTATITYTGEVDDVTGAFITLTPEGTPVGGPLVVNQAALTAGAIGIADIVSIDVNVGNFCFATDPGTCGGVGALVPITSIDAAAITGSSGQLGGNFAVTAFSPTFMVSIPIIFNLDTGRFSADGGLLGTVGGFGTLDVPVVAAPEISTTPTAGSTLDFGDVVAGSSVVTRTIAVANLGDLVLNVGTIMSTGAPADLVISDTCTDPLDPLTGTCVVTLTLTPETPGDFSATVTIPSDDVDVMFTVTGNIVLPAALSSDAPFDEPLMLDSVAVNGSSMDVVTVTNTGGVAATLGTVTMPASPFLLTANDNCSGQLLEGGTSCTIEVEFRPAVAGVFDANFSIQIPSPTLAFGADPLITFMFVESSTLDPVATPSLNSLDFMDTMVNDSKILTLEITNSGLAELTITSVTGLPAPFEVLFENCEGAVIPHDAMPTASCSITIEFSPVAEMTSMEMLSIISDDPGSPLQIAVTGTGTEELIPNILVAPASVNFATPVLTNSMAMDTFTVSNVGTADLAINSIAIAPNPSADFSISDDCVSPLAPMANCTVTVTFAPASGGPLMTTVAVDSDDPDSQQVNVTLSGTGVVAEPNIMLSDAMLDLGVESIGNSTMGSVTVSNMGSTALTISSVTIPVGDYAQTNDCEAAPLAPLGMCTVSITFTPSSAAAAPITSTLTIVSDDPDSMMSTVSLTGRGVLAPEPNIASSVSSLNLGNGLFGAILNGTVVISNNGNAPLTISAVTIGGADAAEFTAGGNCVATLAQATSCTATVQFDPGAPEGAKSAVLSIVSDDTDTPSLNIALSGSSEMPVPLAVFSATSIDFAGTVLGDSVSQTIRVSNTGTGELTVSSITLSGGMGSAFMVSSEDCTAAAVTVNGSCDISVTFSPTTVDDFADTLTINSDDPSMPAATVALTGSGTAVPVPDIAVDVASLAFGSVLFGQTGQLTLTVSNNGTADLNIASADVAPTGDFSAITSCGVLMPAATCTVDVSYVPTIEGDVTATLTITSDDADTPSLNVLLTGTGVAPEPEIDFSSDSLDFGSLVAGTTDSMDLTISNSGMADLTISSLTVSGTDQALFSQVNDCTTLAMNASCTVTVTYAPVAAGTAMATLTVVSNDADEGSVDIGLAGVATPVPMPMINVPATLDIGPVNGGQVGIGSITVSNIGTADLTISGVSVTGANAAAFTQTNACATIAAGSSCDIAVQFVPASMGAATANIVIASNDASSPSTVAVTATALFPVPTLDVSALDLGGVRIGESGNATVTISNSGNATLVVISAVLTGADVADFSLNNGCATVATGASCLITATFTPQSQGSKSAAITVTTNDPNQAVVVIPLSATGAPMEEVVVTVQSKGGNGSFGWLELGGLLLLIGLARRVRFEAVMMGLAILATPLALADDHEGVSKEGYWYAGAGFGSSDGQADVAAITQGIEDETGVSVTSLNIDDTDSGYKLFAGYQASEHLAVEIGYVDLGKAGIDLQLGDVTLAELPLISRGVSGNLSLLGSGVFGSVVVKQSIGELFGVFARVGLISWEVDTAIGGGTSMGNLNIQQTESGTDFTFGVGAEAWFGAGRKFGVRGEWERFELGNQDAEFLSLGGLYRF